MQCISHCGVPSRVQSPSPIGLTWDVIMRDGQIGRETQVSEIVFLMLQQQQPRYQYRYRSVAFVPPSTTAPPLPPGRLDVRGHSAMRCPVRNQMSESAGAICHGNLMGRHDTSVPTLHALCAPDLLLSGSRSALLLARCPPASRSSFFPPKFPEMFIGLMMYAPGSTNQLQDQM